MYIDNEKNVIAIETRVLYANSEAYETQRVIGKKEEKNM